MTSTLLLVAFTAGCNFGKKEPVVVAVDTTSHDLAAATSAAQQVAEEMNAFAFEQRSQLLEKMTAAVETLRQEVKTLAAQVDQAGAKEKAEAAPKLEALREKMALLEKQLVALKGATPTTWEGLKADSLKAYVAVSDGFDQARHWVSEKIAP